MAEALSALTQIKALEPVDGAPHPITVQGVDSEFALYAETSMEVIHVHPRLGGGGGQGGLGQILLGVVLIAVAWWNPVILGMLGVSTGSLYLAGGLMVLGGMLQMLMPTPSDEESPRSKYLGAPGNTVNIGTPISLAYGTVKLSGHYLSFDVDAKDQGGGETTPQDNTNPSNGSAFFLGHVSDVPPQDQNQRSLTQILEALGEGIEDLLDNVLSAGFTVVDSTYAVYDFQPVDAPVVLPIFASAEAGPENVPTSGWII